MIGKSAWFSRRKYGGWGLSPKTWQGWVYIGVFAGIAALIQSLPLPTDTKQYGTYALVGIILLDVLHIMSILKKDELEVRVEALAERNSAWAMVSVLAVGLIYQSVQSEIRGTSQVDMFLIATLAAGVIVKALSNWWLERKGI